MRPAKTRISLGILPVWSESSLCAQWVAKYPRFLHADSEDSDQTGRIPSWSESSLGAHSFCWFCHVAAHLSVRRSKGIFVSVSIWDCQASVTVYIWTRLIRYTSSRILGTKWPPYTWCCVLTFSNSQRSAFAFNYYMHFAWPCIIPSSMHATCNLRRRKQQSKFKLLLWFLTVTCSSCPYLYFGSPIMWVMFLKINNAKKYVLQFWTILHNWNLI